jgi:hypothetical protein
MEILAAITTILVFGTLIIGLFKLATTKTS